MVRYEKDRLVITLDLEHWDTPESCRSQLMKSLIGIIGALDKDRLTDQGLELWWLLNLLKGLVDEG